MQASLKSHQMNNLLLQFTNIAATTSELHFFFYNQKSRHSNIRGMSAKVKGNMLAFETFSNKITSSTFKNESKGLL